MVTTRSGASSSGNGIVALERQCNLRPTPSPVAPPNKKRARVSQTHEKSDSEVPRDHRLINMPNEILAEIFSGVRPGDLLSLSWTCKLFRSIVMKKSAASIWGSAEANVPHLPAYPWSNLSPPAYAAVLFSKFCTSCGVHTSIDADPYLLVRFCSSCREEDLVEISRREDDTKMFYKVVVKTNKIRLATKNKQRRSRGSGAPEYCLRQELESVRDAYQTLSRVGCSVTLRRWKEDLQAEVKLRNQFALQLQKFMRETDQNRALKFKNKVEERRTEILRRLRELGWKDEEFKMKYNKEWDALVNQSRPLTERVWNNILPKLVPLLEAKRMAIEEAAKQERRKIRTNRLSTLLELLLFKMHPFASLVHALQFTPEIRDTSTDTNVTSQLVIKFLESAPFPDARAASGWPWIAEVIDTDITLPELDDLFCANLTDVDDRAFDWRRDIEKQLAVTILAERAECNEFDPDDPNWDAGFTLTVGGDTEPLKRIGFLAGFLLRADTIFRLSGEEVSRTKEEFSYYPNLTSTFGSLYWSSDDLCNVTASSYRRHALAEKVSKALLRGIKMEDASYLELAVMGEVFVCGRCYLQKAKDWKGMVQHYLDELKSWDVSLMVNPRFKTRHPVDYYNAHSISRSIDDTPLTRVVTAQEVADMNQTAVQSGNPIACIPCKNYARMYVSTNMEAMECHLDKTHYTSLPAVEGIHFEPVVGSTNFLQSGGKWKDRWDAYYDEHTE